MINKKVVGVLNVFIVLIFVSTFVSAGIGISYNQESALVPEDSETCLTYSVYNPYPKDTYAKVSLDGEIADLLILQDTEAKLIPGETSSDEAMPIEFCFKVPEVYERDHKISGRFIDRLECEGELRVYEGDVVFSSVPAPTEIEGTGGSTTKMSVSAPIRIRVDCNPYSWNYVPVYILLALISALVILIVLFKKYRKPKAERDKEKLRKLREEIAKASKGSRKSKSKKKKK